MKKIMTTRRKTLEQFIIDAIKIHGYKYDYSLVKYKNNKTKVIIICKEHGEFEQRPDSHLKGKGCLKCGINNIKKVLSSNTSDFIINANKIHNYKYDYSLVDYKNNRHKVKIICKEHGIFEQTPSSHLSGQGCKKCIGRLVSDTNSFIKESNKVHNNKFDYSLVNYTNTKEKVKIICNIHGIFEQIPNAHLSGQGCPICRYENLKITKQEFILRSNEIHNSKYDYSLVDYINSHTKVKIICPIHGIFEQPPHSHLRGYGCVNCVNLSKTFTNLIFIEKSNLVHNNKYDYSLVNYIGANKKVKIICPIHGIFEQQPNQHLNRNGCISCRNDNRRKPLNKFIEQANTIHNNKYDYSLADYKNSNINIKIICPIHGVFEQTPSRHLKYLGCSICNESVGERKIRLFLEANNIDYIYQKRFKNCKNKSKLPFDFYLPKYNICIEFDGKQHYELNSFFGGEDGLIYRKKLDEIKNKFCEENNIKLLRIRYDENVEEKLNNYLIFLT